MPTLQQPILPSLFDGEEPDELHRCPATQEFQAWAFAVRASAEVMQALADEATAKERALQQLLEEPSPDAAAVGTLVLQIRARHLEIERLIRALPALEKSGLPGERTACGTLRWSGSGPRGPGRLVSLRPGSGRGRAQS